MEVYRQTLASKEMIEAAFESAYEGIVITDNKGIIIMINKTYAEFLRVRVDDVIGKHVTKIIENTRMHIVAQTGKAELAQVQRIHGGKMLVHRIPIFHNGQVIAVVGKVLFQDVKELHALSKRVNQLEQELSYYKGEFLKHLGIRYGLEDIIGSSPVLQKLKKLVKKVAASDTTVFIGGESGTGKEMFAHAIHQLSHRRLEPFVKVNCAAIPESLLESILFGYADGAFTGAVRGGRKGKFEMAHGGSIFLDEIGELTLSMQAKLLRVLQEKEIEPVGAIHPVKIDVRIITASNRHLDQMVKENRFREDLYYRLNVLALTLPPLRERLEDIPELTYHLLDELAQEIGVYVKGVAPEVMDCLLAYHWPGNVRELRNVLERSLHLMEGKMIQIEHLPYHLVTQHQTAQHRYSLRTAVEQAEREIIHRVLKITKGDREQAIQLLGISRSGFYHKLKKYMLSSVK
ncbi:sigma-54-dependent Fis family transcriptional regulator [Thermoflavimicrobium daqui]|uniref:Sigma-54-dependent Fis family transcriptional regulator n=1 Tax=Thermoflavimicrobium daqui TaxID=2137476 RepID=A0A364K875_9BACL|nr:sigma-54-dependent Fis family transcriptional regulator [Thermoflavimicrobium daqui]